MKQLISLTILLTICSCSNLNQVRTDGGRNFNGKVVNILYVETNTGVEKIRTRLIQEFGQPIAITDNELTWQLNSNNQIDNDPMMMTVQLDSTFHYEGQKRIFDFVNFDICLTDKEGNDLLVDKNIKYSGRIMFQKLIDEIE